LAILIGRAIVAGGCLATGVTCGINASRAGCDLGGCGGHRQNCRQGETCNAFTYGAKFDSFQSIHGELLMGDIEEFSKADM
jgi:hypothetical protein